MAADTDDRVTTICYGKEEVWSTRQAAIDHFSEGADSCEDSERERYSMILLKLLMGWNRCTDDYT